MRIIKEIVPYILIVVFVVLIRTYIVTPVTVSGSSMETTLYTGDIMLLKKYNQNNLKRNDIVVIKRENDYLIKRLIGLPGEKVKCVGGIIYVNNKELESDFGTNETDNFSEVELQSDEYFVIGDNRKDSYDSRYFGPVKSSQILGNTNVIIFPFKHIGIVK